MHHQFIEAALRSPFYQKKLNGISLDTWADIPFTEKHELRDADSFSLLGTAVADIASYHETSGTTGKPTSSWYSFRDVENESKLVSESHLALRRGDLLLNRLTFTVAVASFIGLWATQYTKCGHISLAKSDVSTPVRVLDVIKRTQPTVLMEIPFQLEILAGVKQRLGFQTPTSLRALLAAGELVSPSRRKWLQSLWKVPVYNLFGSTETGGLVTSCHQGHFHLDNPTVLFEVVDDDGQPLGFEQRGQLVLSTLRQGMPLLRFATHDIVELKPAEICTCGNSHPVLIHYGRQEDVTRIGGHSWTLYDLQEIVYNLPRIPMAWKFVLNKESVAFLYQPFVECESQSEQDVLSAELSAKLQVPVAVSCTEIVPQASLLQQSNTTKFKYVSEVTDEEFADKAI
ncbi:phenylacetate--CoA ligase family protein [Alicyclobacillus sp. SO9]|uniref:phenylacetate--CoA ligase family protein n=1 Tax=Alicyclobacillus sp. SO9 TaxID=2665646 RepID=UPI0018E878E1|nr:AMP-binding protein [Alicyclobacillus sp. SO9]QQE77917.1 phenylacetate--CoA ligase family protein [Alicyclobacillus sp. SO9]